MGVMDDLNLESRSGRSVRVCVWQGRSVSGDLGLALEQVRTVCMRAAAQDDRLRVELILFPELFACGYDCDDAKLRAYAISQNGRALRAVGEVARESGICIALPYVENENNSDKVYNACALFDSNGELVLNYRKVNLWGDWEQATFERGDQLKCVSLQLSSGITVRLGILICYDIEFPEPARCLATQGAEVLLVPTALGSGDVEFTTPLKVLPTRALENHVFILYANFEGEACENGRERNVPSFCGRSAVLAPDGEDLVRAGETSDGQLITAALHLDAYAESIRRNPYLSDRWDRLQSGNYDILGKGIDDEEPLGVKLEKVILEPPKVNSTVDDVARTERLRVQKFVKGLTCEDFAYGSDHESQFIRLYLPDESRRWLADKSGTLPVLFLIHGGFWKSKWSCENTQTTSLVPDFLDRSFAVVLVEYRRREMPGGRWPGPEEDVVCALQYLATLARTQPIDISRVLVLGHSAGAQLALVACHRAMTNSNTASVLPALCVAVAPVPDMLAGYDEKLSDEGDAMEQYMGFHPDNEERRRQYENASMSYHLPLEFPALLVVGTEDVDVPPQLVLDFYKKCKTNSTHNGSVDLMYIYGADHYNVISGGNIHWKKLARKIVQVLQDTCGWKLVPNPDDYDVTVDRGFLPSPDPMQDCSSGVSYKSKGEKHCEPSETIFSIWENTAATLPSHLCAGTVRKHILSLPVPAVGGGDATKAKTQPLQEWQVHLLADEGRAERAFLILSWLGHAWVWGEDRNDVSQQLPPCIAVPWVEVARIVGRPPILTYFSFNANNWRRLHLDGPIALGNTCRLNNFLGGQDEEWFSAVHVAIEALAGQGLLAAVRAQRIVSQHEVIGELSVSQISQITEELQLVADTVEKMTRTLRRMKERCDPYIYYMRVRMFMKGWTADELVDGMEYAGVPVTEPKSVETVYRREYYFGETGAQSSVIPAFDAALGVEMTQDELLPYLKAMRDYMPPKHSDFIARLECGPSVRRMVLKIAAGSSKTDDERSLVKAYNRCLTNLTTFRSVHFELAYSFVRKWDEREDDEIKGTGGTPFMPYLKKHRLATKDLLVEL